MPPPWRQTVTFDNGTEFARHHRLHALGLATCFCDPHAPWHKGGIEHAIGRLRRTLPRKTDLVGLPDDRFRQVVQASNHTPRKCLGYQTPAEVFWTHVLHLKCESTGSRGRPLAVGRQVSGWTTNHQPPGAPAWIKATHLRHSSGVEDGRRACKNGRPYQVGA